MTDQPQTKWEVYDSREQRVVGTINYTKSSFARGRARKLNSEYGAERYVARPVGGWAAPAPRATLIVVGGEWFYRINGDTLRFGPFATATGAATSARSRGYSVDLTQDS